MLIKIIMLNNTNKTIIYSMMFVVGKIVFMPSQTPDKNLVFSSSDAVDCYVYVVLARSTNVSME